MAVKFMHIPNDDTQNFPLCRLELVVEIFGKPTFFSAQSKLNKGPKKCKAKKIGTLIIIKV